MTCSETQVNLSLYLYGELDFAGEEALEQHLADCPMCQLALAREKRWHTTLNGVSRPVPVGVLAERRQNLFDSLRAEREPAVRRSWFSRLNLSDLWTPWGFRATQWSGRVAFASFFLFAGMLVSRWTQHSLPGTPAFNQMGLVGNTESRVRDIQPAPDGRIRIVVDRMEQREVVGLAADPTVRQLLVAATRSSADPSLRIDSVELLRQDVGEDIRDAMLACVRHDANAAVRLKAIDSLRRFSAEPATRQALVYVLERDPDAGVRSRAIDVLLPPRSQVQIGPDLIRALEGVSRAERENDYVRGRCLQILQAVDASAFDSDSIY